MSWGQAARDIRFENISVNDGLSQSSGRVVIQDSKGFLWFGTQDGLNKYDGHSFTIYNNDPLDTNSLSDNFIQDITEDEEGILWIGYNTGGMDRFDPDNEIFTHYKNRPGDTSSISNLRLRRQAGEDDGRAVCLPRTFKGRSAYGCGQCQGASVASGR